MITEIEWTKNVFAGDAATFATRYEGVSAGVVVYVVESMGTGSGRRFKAWRLTSDGGWHPVGDGRRLRLMRNGKEECEFEWEGFDDDARGAIVNELRDRQQHVDALTKLGVTGAERFTMAELVHEVEQRSEREAAANTTVTFSAPLPPELRKPEPVSSRYENDLTELDGFRLGDLVTFGQWPERWRVERLLPAEGNLANAAALVDVDPRPGQGEHRTAGPLRFMRKIEPELPEAPPATAYVRVQPLSRDAEYLAYVVAMEPGERRNVRLNGFPALVVGVDAIVPNATADALTEMRGERDRARQQGEEWRARARERGEAYRKLLADYETAGAAVEAAHAQVAAASRVVDNVDRFGDVMRDVLKGWTAGSMENDEARQVRDRVTDPELVVFHPADVRAMIDDAVREAKQ